MEFELFLSKFEEQFQEIEPGSIAKGTKFKDVPEWGSLTALCVIAMVDETFSKTLSGDDFEKCDTVEDLFNLVRNR